MTELEMKLLAQLKGLLSDIQGLMGESNGVYGLHLNGDVSPWSEIEEGGRFERLTHLSSAQEVISEAEAAQQQDPRPSDDCWIPWAGSVKRPTPPFAHVEVRYRNGVEDDSEAHKFNWESNGHDYDIVAYRIVGEQQ